MEKYKVAIRKITKLSNELYEYQLEMPENIAWLAGAHMHVALEGFDAGESVDKTLVHHMSILSMPEDGHITFVTRIGASDTRSAFKNKLTELGVGDFVYIFKFQSAIKLEKDIRTVFVSQGVGLVPCVALMRHFEERAPEGAEVVSLQVAKAGDHIYKQQVDHYIGDEHAHWFESRDDLKEALRAEVARASADGVHAKYVLVGSKAFIKTQIDTLKELHVSDFDILLDKKPAKRIEFGLMPLVVDEVTKL